MQVLILKVNSGLNVYSDTRDWRSHITLMHEHRTKIDKTLTFTEKQLDALHTEISRSLEKIGSREKYLNSQLESLLMEYRNLQVIKLGLTERIFLRICLAMLELISLSVWVRVVRST